MQNVHAGHAKHDHVTLNHVIVQFLSRDCEQTKYFGVCHQEYSVEKCCAEQMLPRFLGGIFSSVYFNILAWKGNASIGILLATVALINGNFFLAEPQGLKNVLNNLGT